jgi:hypothetical protein
MFFAPGLIFGGTEGFGPRFHVMRARNRFRWFRGRRVSFSCFARPDSFSAVPRASCPFFMFCAPGLVFDGTESVGPFIHVLRSRNRFQRYRGRQVSFSRFARPGLVFDGTGGVGSYFLILRARTRFRRYRGCRVPFSPFALHHSFSAVPGRRVPFSCLLC